MTLLFTVFLMVAGQPQPVVMDYVDLGQVTAEECRAEGQTTAMDLMALHPACQARQCFTLLRCKAEGVDAPDDAGDAI